MQLSPLVNRKPAGALCARPAGWVALGAENAQAMAAGGKAGMAVGACGRYTSAMRALLFLAALAPGLFVLNGCASTQPDAPEPPAWSYYDACYEGYRTAKEFFVLTVECGRTNRNAACEKCSALGNAFVRYADALEQSVKQKQMSDPEAYRRLVEYETQLALAVEKQGEAQAAAQAAATAQIISTAIQPTPPPPPRPQLNCQTINMGGGISHTNCY